MRLRVIFFLKLLSACLISQNSHLKKIHESKIGLYYSFNNNVELILKLDSFLNSKTEKTFALFKHKLSKPIKFEFYQNENLVLLKCGWDTTKLKFAYERLVCSENINTIQITNPGSSLLTDSIYNKWGGPYKVIFHHYIHVLLNEMVNSELPKCFSEGLAVYFAQQIKFDKQIKDILLQRTKDYYVPPVRELLSDKKIKKYPNIYHWSFLFCKYIIDKYGWDRMLEILNNPSNFYGIMEKNEYELNNEWYDYLTKKYPDM